MVSKLTMLSKEETDKLLTGKTRSIKSSINEAMLQEFTNSIEMLDSTVDGFTVELEEDDEKEVTKHIKLAAKACGVKIIIKEEGHEGGKVLGVYRKSG